MKGRDQADGQQWHVKQDWCVGWQREHQKVLIVLSFRSPNECKYFLDGYDSRGACGATLFTPCVPERGVEFRGLDMAREYGVKAWMVATFTNHGTNRLHSLMLLKTKSTSLHCREIAFLRKSYIALNRSQFDIKPNYRTNRWRGSVYRWWAQHRIKKFDHRSSESSVLAKGSVKPDCRHNLSKIFSHANKVTLQPKS